MASENIAPTTPYGMAAKTMRFEGILELCEECQVNGANANEQHRSEIIKAPDLLFLLACEAEYEPVGKLLLECLQLWHSRCDYLRR